jgi:hypothetical protein
VETSATFPGLAAIVPSARRFVRSVLADSPGGDDMELIASACQQCDPPYPGW